MKKQITLVIAIAAIAAMVRGGEDAAKDSRLIKQKEYGNKNYFPMTVPDSKEAWEKRRVEIREQVLVANGLWPMPEMTPLKPTIHGKIERDGYTIEKVFFASYPGHYVTGNLYRPIGKTGKLPAVLSPHGHWANGRFFDAGEKKALLEMKSGAEKTIESGRYPLQARCAQLARLGCVVFHYDMVGNADSQQIPHRAGFTDPEAELRLQSFMGLQTYNSIRSLDFLLSLPDVDPTRVGVTGASGGGTQTFILCAIDDRPAAAFPAVMVSTDMQGGCICENCSYLRVGVGNIDLAAMMAPRPLGMSGANDWTKDIETKGLPDLKALYKMYGVEDKVMAKTFIQFGHNYNQVSREVMYNFFNKHLKLGHMKTIEEKPFKPVPPKELSVFDDQNPRPKDAGDVNQLRAYLTKSSTMQMEGLRERMAKGGKGYEEFRHTLGTALRVMIGDSLPAAADVVEVSKSERAEKDGVFSRRYVLSRKGQHEAIPAIGLRGKDFDGTVVVWVHPDGLKSLWSQDKLVPAAAQILKKKSAIFAVDVFGTGALAKGRDLPINKGYAGYTFGYNRTLLANRVHDILTAVAFAKKHDQTKQVHLVGVGEAGPWVALARGLCGDAVTRTAADLNRFRFEGILSMNNDMIQPGALKYGGLPALTALSAPHQLLVHNSQGTGVERWLPDAYRAAAKQGPDNLRVESATLPADKVIDWILR
jgi:hypothetical protein